MRAVMGGRLGYPLFLKPQIANFIAAFKKNLLQIATNFGQKNCKVGLNRYVLAINTCNKQYDLLIRSYFLFISVTEIID